MLVNGGCPLPPNGYDCDDVCENCGFHLDHGIGGDLHCPKCGEEFGQWFADEVTGEVFDIGISEELLQKRYPGETEESFCRRFKELHPREHLRLHPRPEREG